MATVRRALRNNSTIQFCFFILPLLFIAWTHIFLAPYTKVEESFSIQAVHDFLTHGGWLKSQKDNFDHLTFSGAVPRSFIGPGLLAIIAYPALVLGRYSNFVQSSADVGLIVRLTLATLHVVALVIFVQLIFGRQDNATGTKTRFVQRTSILARRFFYLIYASQFQALFWAGRTTPNGIVMPAVMIGLGLVLCGNRSIRAAHLGIAILTASAVIGRLELVCTIAPSVFILLLIQRSSSFKIVQKGAKIEQIRQTGLLQKFYRVFFVGLVSGSLALAAAVVIDTYMWNRPFRIWNPLSVHSALKEPGLLWAELEAVLFNVIQGKSSDWGTSPWHDYLLRALPKLLSCNILFVLIGIPVICTADANGQKQRLRSALYISAFHVALMSFLAHKEPRFIAYTVPLLNSIGAYAAARIWQSSWQHSRIAQVLARLAVAGVIGASFCLSVISLLASAQNYPGGQALKTLHAVERDSMHAVVHIDVLPAMTGVTLFQSSHDIRRRMRPNDQQGAFGTSWLPCAICSSATAENVEQQHLWTYDKTESISWHRDPITQTFTHILSDQKDCHIGNLFEQMNDSTTGAPFAFHEFDRIRLLSVREFFDRAKHVTLSNWQAILPFELQTRDVVWLCQKKTHAAM